MWVPPYLLIFAGILLLAAILAIVLLNRRNARSNPFYRKKPSSLSRQSCSYCRRKVPSKEIAFYSGPGKVVGVCRQCRPQAERQSLLRL
ncbi:MULTISPECIES: hypothetical protein [Paenibacillus]|uniref:hypothetical protein n=1 Tax=Paenibacillus TaxID=44249 RepID=UPI0022B8F1CA|nr:hypothetical protein [Paenibacillus caseinilyticus]MCZ8523125.1 hypothetical protein [Paenibacillus caseinilyticus]